MSNVVLNLKNASDESRTVRISMQVRNGNLRETISRKVVMPAREVSKVKVPFTVEGTYVLRVFDRGKRVYQERGVM